MPSCPPTCSKVKRDLKKLAAERKRALEGRPGPSQEKSTELEEELYNYELDEALSKSARSKSGKSYKSVEAKSLCSGRSNLKNTGNDFEDSDDYEKSNDESRDERYERQCFQIVEDLPRTKRRGRRRNREEYESDESGDYTSPSRKHCASKCSSKKSKDEAIKRKQKDPDDYRLNKGINYFDDLCFCSSLCLAKNLWSKAGIRKFIFSLALFGVGFKICYDLDGWQIRV
ncbi:uncharacterized protein LOC122508460 [Leptopilina heterotoma]|uniref:uncharacterized protein LOC122508460 n=1 Tax=Leptopilina heterotoma TaxID=63436 RepID=UPI001CA7F966|nr:uncharacterized protein LOC122508460 [Leptopilina heterotoma]